MKKRKIKNKNIILSIILLIILISICSYGYYRYDQYQKNIELQKQLEKERQEKLLKEIQSNYSEYVITTKDTTLYQKNNNNFIQIGSISNDIIINLETITPTLKDEYFKIINLDKEYYISYKDVKPNEKPVKNERYLKYIKLDKEITTNESTTLYLNDKVVYYFNNPMTFPVYKIKDDKYYVEYDKQLMYILKEDILEEKEIKNSESYATTIPVIAYHFFYDPDKGEKCNQSICHTRKQFTSHLDYIKDNNFFTPTMEEFELFMEGKIRLPKKSVLITIDDGYLGGLGVELLKEYQLNGTIFLITSAYDKKWYVNEYVEVHSHTDNMHTTGVCKGGQGGGLKCLGHDKIVADLKLSREKLDGSTVLCYPFYEYNNDTIKYAKEAGFTMGFGGYKHGGTTKATIGGDKFRIPRFTMRSSSTVKDLKDKIG